MVKVEGRVCSGRALASDHLAQHRVQLSRLLGVDPQPGSLNIVLSQPLKLSAESGVWLGQDKHRMVWEAYLDEYRVLLYRWHGCPLSVIEVISDLHLRSELEFTDDASVTLTICRNYLEDIRVRALLGWILLWKWRAPLYYKSGYERWIVSAQLYFDGAIGG